MNFKCLEVPLSIVLHFISWYTMSGVQFEQRKHLSDMYLITWVYFTISLLRRRVELATAHGSKTKTIEDWCSQDFCAIKISSRCDYRAFFYVLYICVYIYVSLWYLFLFSVCLFIHFFLSTYQSKLIMGIYGIEVKEWIKWRAKLI